MAARHTRRVFFLHGFASSSRSTKATYFGQKCAARGVPYRAPDFNEPDFATLTMTRMLGQLGEELVHGDGQGAPAALIGSSLGGALAILAAARFADRIDRLVLLAPAVMFGRPEDRMLPPERIDAWRRAGALRFFHYAYGEERPLEFAFYQDSLRYDVFDAPVVQPTLVFQGRHDAAVDYRTVEAFARTRANVTLSLLDDDHQLTASLPRMWNDMAPFLELA